MIDTSLYLISRCRLFENLRMLPHAPGVQMSNIPEDSLTADDKADADKENPDERISSKFKLSGVFNVAIIVKGGIF